jgi:hypothetical protein
MEESVDLSKLTIKGHGACPPAGAPQGVAMKQKPGGNGSGKLRIDQHDMGGWVRVSARKQNLPDNLPVYLSQALSDWFRQRPHLRLRFIVPIQRDGDTVELHAWYDAHLFPAVQGPRPEAHEPA